jgi:hypothetical protein
MTITVTGAPCGGRRPSDQVVEAAIDGAARALLPPTLRERYTEIADAAEREHL